MRTGNAIGRLPGDFAERFWSQVAVAEGDGCWIWTGSCFSTPGTYGRVCLPDGRQASAHRVAWALTHGSVSARALVRHRCDVATCVRPDHLQLGSHADNTRDALVRGRLARGERHGCAKLTERQVREILHGLAAGRSQREIARAFGVSQPTVSMIATGRSWGQVQR